MNILQAIVLGIVEGITEFLPISSTGHLILASSILKISQTEFLKTFEIAIQFGAILSVVFLYWRKLLWNKEVFFRICAAFLPTAILGLVFYKAVKGLLGSDSVVLWALLIGGIGLIGFEWWHREHPEAVGKIENISYKNAVIIGLFQSIAMVPGVSRSAATILGGLLLGLKRKTIVEFSFLLAVPTMLAATLLDLYKNASSFDSENFAALGIGFAVSFLVAIAAIKFLLRFIQKRDFSSFGIYRILIAIIFWLFIV